MVVSKSMKRSVYLGNLYRMWFPLVMENLSAYGFKNIRVDTFGLCLTTSCAKTDMSVAFPLIMDGGAT